MCTTASTIELREFLDRDIPAIARHANNPNVVKYMSTRMPSPYTLDDAKWWVETGSKELGINRAITLDDECIGVVGGSLGEHEHSLACEMGYWLAEPYWGKGIATKALALQSDYLLSNTEVIRLFARVFHPNVASMKVLENCGYTLEAIHKSAIAKNNQIYDEHIFVRFRPSLNQET